MTHTYDYSGILRSFVGPKATEVFLLCRPDPALRGEIEGQAESVYRNLRALLRSKGGELEHVIHETVFFRDIHADIDAYRRVRARALGDSFHPATTLIQQPPLDQGTGLEISALAVIPHDRQEARRWDVWSTVPCLCNDCSHMAGQALMMDQERHLRTGNIYGPSRDAYTEAYGMFRAAEELLRQDGMTFSDVVRTWIHLRHIERDYAELNRARRQFFQDRGIELRPASTGIYGAPPPREHNFSLSLHAVKSPKPVRIGVMTTPTLNEAWMYGSDFSRGLKVAEANKVALYVSGTASVDEEGRTAHVGDFDKQVRRMLTNVSTLLRAQSASFPDLVSAITYVKDPENAARLRAIFDEQGLADLPNAIVKANVCRPELLCEMEAIAALPPAETDT